MNRVPMKPRRYWQQQAERLGLTYHSVDGSPYWDESVCYRFATSEMSVVQAATEELQRLCLQAGQFIIDQNRFDEWQAEMFGEVDRFKSIHTKLIDKWRELRDILIPLRCTSPACRTKKT